MAEAARKYRSTRREQGAASTRQDILDTARRLFIADGYAHVTMTHIAEAAGVATKTLYASVGTKTQVLHALLAADADDSVTDGLFDEMRRCDDLASAAACLARLARTSSERYAPSLELLYSSMASDDKARQVWDYLVAHCRRVFREAAGHLLAMGAAAPALGIDDVADRLWFCFGLAAWRSLVVDCGWSYDAAERLLAGQAVALLQG
ncbi:MAG: TetR/AcrR family transcriptional regulator [Trebonia sp.]